MKFVLELDTQIMVAYAKHLGYTDSEIENLTEQETFKTTLSGILNETCDGVLYCNEKHISLK